MSRSLLSLHSVIFATTLAAPWAHAGTTQADRIFASGFSQALVIEGRAGYPGPLANARVEAHFGEAVAVATTAADGIYRVGIEVDQIDPAAIVELFARGNGAQAHLVWASPLGPASRLLALGGDTHRIGVEQDPFVYLSPRSTAIAAAARAYNQWQPISDEKTFWRAIRSRQSTNDEVFFALAAVAQGAFPLPPDSPDTFAAVSSLSASKALIDAHKAWRSSNCWDLPLPPLCDPWSTLSVDTRMFPPLAFAPDVLYSRSTAFDAFASERRAFRFNASGATAWFGDGVTVEASATLLPDGGYELAPRTGDVLFQYPSWEFAEGILWPVVVQNTRIRIRLVQGPAGQTELGWSSDSRIIFPDDSGIPPKYWDAGTSMPSPSSSNPLPAVLAADIPSLAGGKWVLPSPLARPVDASVGSGLHAYDIHAFAVGGASGLAQRFGVPFDFQAASPGLFALDSGGRHAEYRLFNEEEPGVWRLDMHVRGSDGYEAFVEGVLVAADAPPLTAANVVGTWRSRANGQTYSGPYGDLFSAPLKFTFEADGSAQRVVSYATLAGDWSIADGGGAGRVLAQWDWAEGNCFPYERRGWELVHEDQAHRWVLETLTLCDDEAGVPASPIVFNPTRRLVRYDRE